MTVTKAAGQGSCKRQHSNFFKLLKLLDDAQQPVAGIVNTHIVPVSRSHLHIQTTPCSRSSARPQSKHMVYMVFKHAGHELLHGDANLLNALRNLSSEPPHESWGTGVTTHNWVDAVRPNGKHSNKQDRGLGHKPILRITRRASASSTESPSANKTLTHENEKLAYLAVLALGSTCTWQY